VKRPVKRLKERVLTEMGLAQQMMMMMMM
jgi:hypothetical protein